MPEKNYSEESPVLMPGMDFALGNFPDYHQLMKELRSHGPVVPVNFIGERAWLICGYPQLKSALADEEHFMMAAAYREHALPVMGHTMETMTGDEHRINRSLIARSFLPRAVKRLADTLMVEVLDGLLDNLAGEVEVELMSRLVKPYPFRVITRMMGIPVDDDGKFMHWADVMIQHAWKPEEALRARDEFTAYLAPIVAARREHPEDDLISLLVDAEFEGQRLDDEAIFSFCRLLFPAGSDTTYRSYGSLIASVLAEPSLREQATGDETARLALIEEGLRLEPAACMIPRRCTADIELGGVEIRAGDRALFAIAAANRDPEVFDHADKFQPGRKQKHLAFGNGIHVCLGQHFARAELDRGIRLLFERFPDIVLRDAGPAAITGGMVRGPEALWVKLS